MSIARAGVLLFVLLGACAVPEMNSLPAEDGAARKPVYLVSHGWHAGIVVRRADLPAAVWPESEDFSGV
ncbi:MAG TPA: hypothetical protein VJ396_08210, partial [Acidiferrobacterales bacterium]|nr:hypothetical protein [Acidiferrobacterales bacterium]